MPDPFSDADPEDAWSAGDSTDEQLRVVMRMLRFVIDRNDELTPHERFRRLQSIDDSVSFVAERLRKAIFELRGDN